MSPKEILILIISVLLIGGLSVGFTFLFKKVYASFTKEVEAGSNDETLLLEEKKRQAHPKRRRTLSLIFRIVIDVILGILLLLCGYGLTQRARGQDAFLFGTEPLVITSGSMSYKNEANAYLDANHLDNQFKALDLIGISQYGEKDPQLYDVVAYKSDSGLVIVHRIVEVTEKDGTTVYLTRGDANAAADAGVEYADYLQRAKIIGYYNGFRWQGIGGLILFFQSYYGIVTVAGLAYCFLAYDHYKSQYEKSCESRLDALKKSEQAVVEPQAETK
jgi:signal peptidase